MTFLNRAYWSDGIEIQDGAYVRRLVDVSQPVPRQVLVPMHDAVKRAVFLPDETWVPRETNRALSSCGARWVRLVPAELKEIETGQFPTQVGVNNRLFEFYYAGTRYVVDAITLLQRIVALRPELFAVLLSPFRELAIRSRRTHSTVDVVLKLSAGSGAICLGPSLLRLPDADVSCLAYWTQSPAMLNELDWCHSSIVTRKALHVPRVDVALWCLARGRSDGNTVFVQSLLHKQSLGKKKWLDVLWRDNFSCVRLANPNGRSGCEVVIDAPRPSHDGGPFAEGSVEDCRPKRRSMNKSEIEQVVARVGWGFSAPSEGGLLMVN